jgi:malate dehydrogenase
MNRFAEAVLKGLSGEKGIVTPSFVYLPGVPGGDAIAKETGCDFFSVPVELGVSSLRQPVKNSTKFYNRQAVLRRFTTPSQTWMTTRRLFSRLVSRA